MIWAKVALFCIVGLVVIAQPLTLPAFALGYFAARSR